MAIKQAFMKLIPGRLSQCEWFLKVLLDAYMNFFTNMVNELNLHNDDIVKIQISVDIGKRDKEEPIDCQFQVRKRGRVLKN